MRDITITVAYASVQKQLELAVTVPAHANIAIAIKRSGILNEFPELVFEELVVGINSKVLALDAALSANDRVEIYRPLTIDPKEARRKRAK